MSLQYFLRGEHKINSFYQKQRIPRFNYINGLEDCIINFFFVLPKEIYFSIEGKMRCA